MRHSSKAWLLALALAAPAAVQAEGTSAWRVIVNPKNPVGALEKSFVADALLKKATRWSDGQIIRPVDLPAGNPTREEVSKELLGRPVAAVKSYWEQIIFSGRGVPPPELDTDEAVIAYVAKHEGAIGYVSARADVAAVRVVPVK